MLLINAKNNINKVTLSYFLIKSVLIISSIERKYGIRSYRHSLHGSWPNWCSIIKAETRTKEVKTSIENRNFLFICLVIFILEVKSR